MPVAGVTVTGTDFVALLPKLSVAATVSVSALVELSLSFRVVRSASTWDSVPAMVNVLLPLDGVIVPPPPVAPVLADRTPEPSDTMTVKVSPLVVVLPVSETLTPEIAVATFCATVALAGALIDGAPFTVTAIEAGPADPPLLSEALTEITSDAVVASVSASVVRSALTCEREPAIVSVLPPFEGVIVPPPPLTAGGRRQHARAVRQRDRERLARRRRQFREAHAGDRACA